MAKQYEQVRAHGVIRGTVISHDGQLARNVGLEACPLGVALGAILPRTRTNEKGEYRFEVVPWWGRYTVYAEDEEAGYSFYSSDARGRGKPPEVELSKEHPEAELNVRLPAPAGFLLLHLTNGKTGDEIPGVQITVMAAEGTPSFLFSQSCAANRAILIPPDKDVLLHVTAPGFQEWDQSIRSGKALRMASGSRTKLEVHLDALPSPQQPVLKDRL
jgi:hypothetical protein